MPVNVLTSKGNSEITDDELNLIQKEINRVGLPIEPFKNPQGNVLWLIKGKISDNDIGIFVKMYNEIFNGKRFLHMNTGTHGDA